MTEKRIKMSRMRNKLYRDRLGLGVNEGWSKPVVVSAPPDFGNLLAVLRRERPSRPPLFEFFLNGSLYEKLAGLSFPKDNNLLERMRVWVSAFKNAGYDYAAVPGSLFAFPKREHRQEKTMSLTESSLIHNRKDFEGYDAVKEYRMPDFKELVNFYETLYQEKQSFFENQVFTGGYYKSVISGAIEAFGWDMLLMAAVDQERFAKVLRSFGDLTLHHVRAWAETSIKIFIQHDDIVWTSGPFIHPDFYRAVIFPIYKELWDVFHQAGKKVLFCSDGKFDMFMDDIAAAGADGFIFEPCNDFDEIVRKFGKTHCLVGSKVDCRSMAFAGWDKVKEEIDATLRLSPQCAGLIWAIGNHIPSNVPEEIGLKYIDYLKTHWSR